MYKHVHIYTSIHIHACTCIYTLYIVHVYVGGGCTLLIFTVQWSPWHVHLPIPVLPLLYIFYPPIVMGAWSMAFLLGQHGEY